MARFSVSVKPYNSADRPRSRWVVNVNHPTSGRTRKFCETKREADFYANSRRDEAAKFGQRATELNDSRRMEALAAFDLCDTLGVTLSDVIRDFERRRSSSTATVTEVAEKFLRSRADLKRSKRHLDGLRGFLGNFGSFFGQDRIVDLSLERVQDWLFTAEVEAQTINHRRAMLHSLFAFAKKRRILKENIIADIDKQKVVSGKVGILTPAQMLALLRASEGQPDLIATFAIGGFAGIRPEEVTRLRWEDIDLEQGQIDCSAYITKTARHRYVKIEPVLAAWLNTCLDIRKLKGRIKSVNFRRRFDLVRTVCGFSLKGSKGIPWPYDGLRHSYASYHLPQFSNADLLAIQMGHRGTAMIFSNYRERVSAKAAAAWWSQFPEAQ